MKKNYSETSAATIIMSVIIIGFILIVAFSAFRSDSYFNNNSEESSTYQKVTPNDNTNTESSPPENLNIELKTVETEFASYTSKIYDDDANRVHNISVACKKLNGYVIKSGKEFSFNNALGPMGKADGYKKYIGFDSNGNKIKVYGGGICQLSSTIYNTALISNFKITERHVHSRRVNYVPKNKDATIMYGSLDLKFVNNSGFDIKIKSTTDGNECTVTFYKIEQKVNEVQ